MTREASGRRHVPGARLVAALFATALVVGGGLLALLGLAALGLALLGMDAPWSLGFGILALAAACAGAGALLGWRVRRG